MMGPAGTTNLLITGPPRCGKSTLIRKLVRRIERPATGFFTEEIREHGRRTGFAIETLAGKRGVLAHEDLKGPARVGKYGVNLSDLEEIAVPSMTPSRPEEIVVIDEVGKMECLSSLFREQLLMVLALPNRVIGSIALKGDKFIEKIKARPDVRVVELTTENRNDPDLIEELLAALR